MKVQSILNEVERLHATAKLYKAVNIKGEIYELTFNGNNYDVTLRGNRLVTLNTRSIGQAQTWLREWLNN